MACAGDDQSDLQHLSKKLPSRVVPLIMSCVGLRRYCASTTSGHKRQEGEVTRNLLNLCWIILHRPWSGYFIFGGQHGHTKLHSFLNASMPVVIVEKNERMRHHSRLPTFQFPSIFFPSAILLSAVSTPASPISVKCPLHCHSTSSQGIQCTQSACASGSSDLHWTSV